MSCKRPSLSQLRDIVEEELRGDLMNQVMAYVQTNLAEFKLTIEREYFASVIKFKRNHLTIVVNDSIDLNQLRRIKVKNSHHTVELATRQITIGPPAIEYNTLEADT